MKEFNEYNHLRPNEFIITIEHCSSCEEHKHFTNHENISIFKDLAYKFQKIILERFPFIKVLIKPIDVEIVKGERMKFPKLEENGGSYPSYPIVNNQFKECRIGAFEIQIATMNKKNEKIIKVIHSKLKTKKFPDINIVLNKIVSFMPNFNLKLVLFDKEDYDDLEKMNNIQVNLYLCNSPLIKDVVESTQQQVLNFTSPTRRFLMLKKKKLDFEQSYSKIDGNKNIHMFTPISSDRRPASTNKFRAISAISSNDKQIRPVSSIKKTKIENDYYLGDLGVSSYNSSDRFTSINESLFKSNMDKTNQIVYQQILKKQRGFLIKRKFTKIENNEIIGKNEINDNEDEGSESVTLCFEDLPFDTYIIETIENCNFRGSLTLLKFNELNISKDGFITKYIGLWHQENAILNIHLYNEKEVRVSVNASEKNNSNNQTEKKMQRPSSSNTRRKDTNPEKYKIMYEHELIITGIITISDEDNPNSKHTIVPNNKGIYEYKTLPGEYKLEIYNHDYEKQVRKIMLTNGLNTINIKLIPEKRCDLKILVLEYCEISPDVYNYYFNQNNTNDKGEVDQTAGDKIYFEQIRNAEIEIINMDKNLIAEGITNKKGLFNHLVDKNDNNLSVKVSKIGFYQVQRTFTRNPNMNINENGDYECTMTFVLIRIEKLFELNKIIFISYSNICSRLFEFEIQKEDDEKNKYQIQDLQNEAGILLGSFWSENPKKDKNFETNLEQNNDTAIDNCSNSKNDENNIDNENNTNIGEPKDTEEDYDENINFEEILRLGMKLSQECLSSLKNSEEMTRIKYTDIITFLKESNCEINIYTPNYGFHVDIPKFITKSKITSVYKEKNNDEENENDNKEENKVNGNGKNSTIKENLNNIYLDIGWIDVKNNLFYETGIFFKLKYKPDRLLFFENYIDLLQIFIDNKIYDSIFSFFNFEMSILTGGERYLPRKIFEEKIRALIDKENKNNNLHTSESMKRKEDIKNYFLEFFLCIVCGYDEDKNIINDSISLSLLKKKISSNLKNFSNLSYEGIKEDEGDNNILIVEGEGEGQGEQEES